MSGWLVVIGTHLVFTVLSFVVGVVPTMWLASVVLSGLLGFFYGVGRTLHSRGIETRKGGDGTAPSRSDDSPSATRRAKHSGPHINSIMGEGK